MSVSVHTRPQDHFDLALDIPPSAPSARECVLPVAAIYAARILRGEERQRRRMAEARHNH